MLCALGSLHRTDVGGANCCRQRMQTASLSSRATFINYLSFPIAGNKGVETLLYLPYIQYGPAYAVYSRDCA